MNRSFYAIVLVTSANLAVANAEAAAPQKTVKYSCDGGSAVARYDTSSLKGGAVVTYGGHTLSFQSATSGSGARYTTPGGQHAIAPLEWWTKGPSATLSELAQSQTGTNRLIATCSEIR